jgi:pyruvate/2-oxoglutarate dehydrogenase complex dihydrolipoamide acyltransferase (E2) component
MFSTSKLVLTGASIALIAACAQPAKAPAPAPAPAPVAAAPAPAPAPSAASQAAAAGAAQQREAAAGAAAAQSAVTWGTKPVVGRFSCDVGRSVTVSAKDDNNVDLNWQGKNYAMAKVPTSSGAMRFEDKASGLVWIQIPSKSMLMDSKAGRQLAQDCKN